MKKKLIFLGLMLLVSNIYAIDISTCGQYTTSGIYYLTADIKNWSGATYVGGCICFTSGVAGTDFTLDCQGHIIDGTDVANYGVQSYKASGNLGDIIFKNCILSDWNAAGIKLDDFESAYIENIESYSGAAAGITVNGQNLYPFSANNVSCYHNTGNPATYGGILIYNGLKGGNLSNIYVSNNSCNGLWLRDSNNFGINNIVAINNSNINAYGIRMEGNHTLNNFTVKDNYWGIMMGTNDYSNLNISHGIISNNSIYGIQINSGNNNIFIYNNFFNNSVGKNINFGGNAFLNTSLKLGDNIFNSDNPYIAGNFWDNRSGGFSTNCVDSDNNGFCDLDYNLSGSNMDYMPISTFFVANTAPQIDYIYPINETILFNIEDLILGVKVSDYNNDTLILNISYENNSCYYSGITVGSYGIEWICDWNLDLEYNKSYNWSVKVDDGTDSITKTYFFSTLSDEFVHVFGIVGGMSDLGFCDPIEGATVYLHNFNLSHSYLTYSNVDGSYAFTNLDKGTYFVSVTKDGFISHYVDIINYTYGTYDYEDYCLFLEGHNSTWIFNVYDENMSGLINYSLFLWDIYGYEHVNMINNVFNTCSYNCSKTTNQVFIDNIINSHFAFKITHDGFFDYNFLDEFHNYFYMDSNFSSYIILRNISDINQCNISGYVTYVLDDSFLEGIHVQIYEHDFFRGNITTTDSNGFFIFHNVSEGLINLDYKGEHYGFSNIRGYDNYLHVCNDKQYNISMNTTYETKNYVGHIVECGTNMPIQNVKITLTPKFENISIRTTYSDYWGDFIIYNYPSTPEYGYVINFEHIFFQNMNKEIGYHEFNEEFEESDCLNPKCRLYDIFFNVSYNNQSIDLDTTVYLLLELTQKFDTDCNFETMIFSFKGDFPFISIPDNEYKVSVGVEENKYTNSIIFRANKDKIINIEIYDSSTREWLDFFGIPSTEKDVWGWISSWGWGLFFVIFILFILVIIKSQINELR